MNTPATPPTTSPDAPVVAPATPTSFLNQRLDPFLRQYATPLTAALAVVIGVSGTMMFFHFYKPKVQTLHEWLGMGFMLAFVLHVLRNRRIFLGLFKQKLMLVLLLLAATASATFVLSAPAAKTGPERSLLPTLTHVSLAKLAPTLALSEPDALARLQALGVADARADASLDDMAKAAQLEPVKLLNALLPVGSKK